MNASRWMRALAKSGTRRIGRIGYVVPVSSRCPATIHRTRRYLFGLITARMSILCDQPADHPGPHISRVPRVTWEKGAP